MIFKLARLQIRAHRLRTIFAAVATVLTSVLYMTVISISYCILDSTQLSRMLAGGSDYHASVSDTGYSISGEALYHEIQKAPEVSEASLFALAQNVSVEVQYKIGENSEAEIAFVGSEDCLSHFFMTPIVGRFPESQYEIMLYEGAFSSVSVGDRLQFTVACPNGDTKRMTYTVSGLYDCDADRPILAVVLYDENTVQALEIPVDVMIQFYSSFGIDRRLEAVTERLGEWKLPDAEGTEQINYAYAAADIGSFFRPLNVLMILSAVGVVFFAAFLLIYNIFSISLAQDMRTFGLLQVIGTTYRQMKKLTYVQILFIGGVSLPLGLLLGYFIGFKLLSFTFMSLRGTTLPYRFSPCIAWISAVLTWFTLAFSALRPLKRIKNLTPIQSVSAGPQEKKREKTSRRETPVSPFRLAMAGICRSHGRVLVSALSAMVSVLLFVMVGGMVDGYIGNTLDRIGKFDIDLSLECQEQNTNGISTASSFFEGTSFHVSIEPDIIEKLKTSDLVKEMYLLRFERISAEIPPQLEEKIRAYLARYTAQAAQPLQQVYQDILDSGKTDSVILGVPDELCKYLVASKDGERSVYYSGDELYDGRHVLCISTTNEGQLSLSWSFITGDVLSSDALEKDYEVIAAELPYGFHTALHEICSYQYIPSNEVLFLFPMSIFEKEFPNAAVFTVLADAKENMGEPLQKEIRKYVDGRSVDANGRTYLYRIGGKMSELADLHTRLAAIRLTGYSLCGIIFLIGLLNMVNSALTSMVLRQREFAMLETIGMTHSQLRMMLLYENSAGGIFGVAAFLIGSVLSNAMLTHIFQVDIAPVSLPAMGILFFLFAAGGLTAEFSYRILTKLPLNERIRLGE